MGKERIMKKIILLGIILLLQSPVGLMACEICKETQPKLFRGLTHGSGPKGTMDMVIIWSAVVIVLITMYFFIRYLVKPGEKNHNHIKYIVVQNDES